MAINLERQYLSRRAREELKAVEEAACVEAASAHKKLERLYIEECIACDHGRTDECIECDLRAQCDAIQAQQAETDA
ncbi:MAG: hypothetical protein B7Y45_02025 [Sphingomonas sp. 28-66-16]|nr:MAG: hypothetical protein B7Y45_02025 [Sphingomonas sp. 28-66-16]